MPKPKHIFKVIFLVLLLLVPGNSIVAQTVSPNMEIANEYIRIIINTLPENTGRFSVGTTGGDPDRLGDEYQHLIYGGEEPWTSYTTIRIDNQNWVFGNPTTRRAGKAGLYGHQVQAPVIIDNRLVSTWQLGPIEVTQTLEFARSSTTGLMDSVRIEYRLHNHDDVFHDVGLRLMLDTMLGQNDGAPFRLDNLALLSDTVFYRDQIPEFWQAFDSLSNPQVMAQGTLRGTDVSTPDRVYFSNWGSLADDLWNFDFQPGRDFMRKGEFELDSTIAMYWDGRPLPPKQTATYVSYYGLGGVTIAPGDLSVGLTAPTQVVSDTRFEESYTVVAYIQNNGEGDARDIKARIVLPEGLQLVEEGSTTRRLGDLAIGETEQTSWKIRTTGDVTGKVSLAVEVEAINSEPSVAKRDVEIVHPSYLKVDLIGPAGIDIENEQLAGIPVEVTAVMRNVGGAPAYQVEATLNHPMFQLAQGDTATKYPGTIAPNERIEVNWYLNPIGSSGNLIYLVDYSWDAGTNSERNIMFVPFLQPKIWVAAPETYGKDQINTGDHFSVSVWATNTKDFKKAELSMSFNPAVVEIVGKSLDISRGTMFVDQSSTSSKLLGWEIPQVNNTTGKVTKIIGDRGSNQIGGLSSGTLVTIYFRAKAPGNANIRIDAVEVTDSYNYPVSVVIGNREITVE